MGAQFQNRKRPGKFKHQLIRLRPKFCRVSLTPMRTVSVLMIAVVFALLGSGVGYAVGNRSGYTAGSRDGYSQGTHDVCVRFTNDQQQLVKAIANAPNADPKLGQAILAIVATMHSDACR